MSLVAAADLVSASTMKTQVGSSPIKMPSRSTSLPSHSQSEKPSVSLPLPIPTTLATTLAPRLLVVKKRPVPQRPHQFFSVSDYSNLLDLQASDSGATIRVKTVNKRQKYSRLPDSISEGSIVSAL